MPLPESTPRLSKWPFLLGDAALLAAAWLIADYARHPLSTTAIVSIVICGVVAAMAGAIPFLADYARQTDQALDERQKALEALSRSAAAAAEQIGVAATGYQQIAELAQANLQQAEQVQQHLQKTSAEFLSRLSTVRVEEKRKLEKDFAGLRSTEVARLEAVLDKISRAVDDLGRIQVAPAAAAPALPTTPETVGELGIDPAAEPARPPPAPPPEPAADENRVTEAVAALEIAAADEAEPAPDPAAAELPPKTPRKRAKKLPKPEDSSAAPAPPAPGETVGELGVDPAPEPEAAKPDPELAELSEFSQLAPDEGQPTNSVSADGATRLIVTAYIGIGNRLFIRGAGPGLSWERGVALQFVSIGKWRWESAEVTTPVRFKLYKNDEIECTTLAATAIEPGQQQEVTATF